MRQRGHGNFPSSRMLDSKTLGGISRDRIIQSVITLTSRDSQLNMLQLVERNVEIFHLDTEG